MEKGTRLGPYEIVEAIGAGGMGEVYRAKDSRIGRDVAIKVLRSGMHIDPDRMRRFEQEARAVGALNHPGLLVIHDIGQANESPYIVTELLEGETLRERLGVPSNSTSSTDSGKLSMRRVTDWGVQIANGLAAAHEAGIVHRDLKPENIFITRDGRVKILDFGLAKLQSPQSIGSEENTVQRGTDPGTVMGTVGYMSPEQVRGQEVDSRSDIFSLGLILYEMISGRRAFQRESQPETMTAILREDPPDLSTINPTASPSLVRITEHCLEKRPEQRFQSARDLSFHLQQLSDDSGRSTIREATPQRSLLRWWPAAAVVAGALLIGFLGGRAWTSEASVEGAGSSGNAVAVKAITFSGRDLEPSVSPDGKMIAFASARDGKMRIWIKQTNGGSELALTAGIDSTPRFSPDGSSVLFARDEGGGRRSIYKVPILGGEPRKLVDDAYAADWSPDGLSLVCVRSLGGGELAGTVVVTAGSDGSNQKEIATLEGKLLGSPRWSPDGSRIALADWSFGNFAHQPLLIARDGASQQWLDLPVDADIQTAIQWVDVDRLVIGTLPSATNVVSGTGSLILLHDLRSGTTRNLFYVASPVGSLDLLADGRVLLDSLTLRQNLQEVSLAGGAARWLSRGTSVDRQPAYSPDGRQIIFSSNMSGNLDLWVLATEDGSLRRLTDDAADDYDPAFTSGGKSIVWSSKRINDNYEIWMANADGSGARQVSRDGFDAENPTGTGDGEWLLYNSYHAEKKGIWKIRPDGSEAAQITKIDSQLPEVSPDGRYVSFCGVGTGELLVVQLSDGKLFSLGPTRGSVLGSIVTSACRSRWTNDSREVVFVDTDENGRFGLWTQPFIPGKDTQGERRPLPGFVSDLDVESFAFSPDGTKVTISIVDQLSSIMISDPIAELARSETRP